MESPMRRARRGLRGAVLVWLLPAAVHAQDTQPQTSRGWLVAGIASATVRGACQTCENQTPYRHGASVLGDAGYRVNDRMDVGAEVFWVPMDTSEGRLRTTHVDAIAQFRPWTSRGFFLKGGAGMAFVRNWVDSFGPDAINSKALSVVIGGGWHFRPKARLGVELFASQHAAALGDLQLASDDVPDIMGNFWSIGAAIVIR
jgi:Outer membrane protein beta-barrel domain